MKGFKAFHKDLTCRGFQYEVGKTYEMEGLPVPCSRGFHFCATIKDCYDYYDTDGETRICEVEAIGEIKQEENKYCTNRIAIISEVTELRLVHCNVDGTSTGYMNTGNMNTGNRNTGNRNTGNWNTGYRNTGYRNTGNWNTGNMNTGNWNTGNRNTGNWNTGNYSNGCFCTEELPKIKFFDQESDWTLGDWWNSDAKFVLNTCPSSYPRFVSTENMTEEEKSNHPEHEITGGYIKVFDVTEEDRQSWWDGLSEEKKRYCLELPNFDADKFCKCVGLKHI